MKLSHAQQMRGSSLLEVLIALVVLGLGVLGMVAMQATSLKSNQTALVRTQATELANEISDVMRANRNAALAGNYDSSLTAAAPAGTAIHAIDLQNWKTRLALLPAGKGGIARTNTSFTITIQWDESRLKNGSASRQFIYRTEI
jgi:type IV pilus assembly protein PilV